MFESCRAHGAATMAAVQITPQPDATRLAGLLASRTNLRVLAAIVLGADTVDAVAEATGLDRSEVDGAICRLVAAGLVSDEGGLDVDPAAFEEAARKRHPELPDATDEQAAVLRNFVGPDGRLPALPALAARRQQVLEYAAARFERGVEYPEADVNEILRALHDDYVTLRRLLVDAGLLARSAGMYRRP